MRKVIAAINATIDGNVDHTAGLPDTEIHEHYSQLLQNSDVVLYGRTTYQLMQYWQTLIKNPSGDKSADDFALAIDNIEKIVFSKTLKETKWASAKLATKSVDEVVKELKLQTGKDILIGSRSLIMQLMNLKLIDEFQLCIHPVIAGKGLFLSDHLSKGILFTLKNTKTFHSGAITLYYEPKK